MTDFTDFTQFGATNDVHVAGGVPFEIPPIPFSPDTENVHIAGGVPFEIPPLPDFAIDDAVGLNNFLAVAASSSGNDFTFLPSVSAVTVTSTATCMTTEEERVLSGAVPPSTAISMTSQPPSMVNGNDMVGSFQNYSDGDRSTDLGALAMRL